MSNPAVITLADGRLSGKIHVRIEDNLGESIHLHFDKSTFYLTTQEFEDLVGALQTAVGALLSDREIDLNKFDISAFDWDWLKRYRQISSVTQKQMKLSDLYTVNYVDRFGKMCWRYVSLEQSHNYHALQGNTEVLSRYHLSNSYGKSNFDRLQDSLRSIQENGYPFAEKFITVNQYGVIYDGAHRAAALLYLHGSEQTIPVVEITFNDDISPIEQNKRQDQRLKAEIKKEKRLFLPRLLKRAARKLYHLIKQEKKCAVAAPVTQSTPIDYRELTRFIMENKVPVLLIPKPKYSASLAKIADEILITDELGYTKLVSFIKELGIECPAYENYRLIYSVAPPVLLPLKEKTVLLAQQLFCKSLDEDTLLPVDSAIIKRSWETARVGDTSKLLEADLVTVLICVILDAMLEQRAFLQNDREFIIQNKALLNSAMFYQLLKKEFFNFSAKLRDLLVQEAFDEALQQYLTFRDY